MKNYFFCLFILAGCFHSFAQESAIDSLNIEKTIIDQFNDVVDKSGNYQDYKVIKKSELNTFRDQLSQTKSAFEEEIAILKQNLASQEKEIENLANQLKITQENLTKSEEASDSIQLFGANLNKTAYQTGVFASLGILILGLIILSVKFKSNNETTNEAKEALASTNAEFEAYKQKALETQQKLGRQLQDEKNKVNKLKAGGLK